MNDDRRSTDERIAEAARELYHAPPTTPRDEMWSVIEARLAASLQATEPADRQGPADSRGLADPRVIRLDEKRGDGVSGRTGGFPGRAGWWIAVAAALVVGLGIGRLSLAPGDREPQVVLEPGAVVSSDAEPGVAGPEAGVSGGPVEGAGPAEAPPAGVGPGDAAAAVDERPADAGLDPAAAGVGETHATVGGPGAARPRARSGRPYLVATMEHLDRSGTFLAGVPGVLEANAPNPELEAWARSLLTRTRVLMASPVGRDVATRRLLEDLELMLAQIVVTAATGDPAEARILGEGLQDGDLLFRLRSVSENERGPGAARMGTSSL